MNHIHRTFGSCLLLTTCLIASAPDIALADPPADERTGDVTNYRFDEDLVRGDVPRPNVELLHGRRRNDRESLIRVRDHFIRELLKAAEQI